MTTNSIALRPEKSKSLVFEKSDRPMTDSLKVAEQFGKDHKNVMRDIKELDCSSEFSRLNFEPSKRKDERGKWQPIYNMTFDGFIFLVMGYRGRKAAQLKEAYIHEFNRMADFIRKLETAKAESRELTDAIKFAHADGEYHNYHFSNEFDLINRIALGAPAKKIRKERGIPETADSVRPYLTDAEIASVVRLQRFDAGLVVTVQDYEERRRIMTAYHARITTPAISA
ncbi:Rha family transcriptional regulator [Papillibacter cinnamivorans]|uniref:Phage regulatory protein, rha family n=1 Tax=Papillibacter cinnamivorans DSM 12816 TaxID=1122930 RepID=A0A1W1YQL4_9FIRM|nr:Rha family transcriptional regulator [Papillibacter cinnamivorans]SMC38091.1 phage regulatory protein, rha family [Papillibacter cinnamivorans DSM 12816]